jgi:hypothetical protein
VGAGFAAAGLVGAVAFAVTGDSSDFDSFGEVELSVVAAGFSGSSDFCCGVPAAFGGSAAFDSGVGAESADLG